MTSLREEIYEELGNLSEFGEQESKTEIILKLIEERIDNLIQRALLTGEVLTDWPWNDALYKVKEILK